jgi:RluA family pseudouridine synthase
MAKTPEAHRKLALQFARRQTKKTYVALAKGRIEADEGTLESHLARHPGKRQRFAVSGAAGRWSSTKFKVLERTDAATLVELTPLTGRTHQIRVHLATYGHPILGDHVYGLTDPAFPFVTRHLLHARALVVKHPETGADLRFESPLPSDFQQALKLLGFRA